MRFSTLLASIIAFFCLFAAVVHTTPLTTSPLVRRSTSEGDQDLTPSCAVCPKTGVAGDSRCKVYPNFTIGKGGSSNPSTSCKECGCQKCPDSKLYDNSVSDYCTATPSTKCKDINSVIQCKFVCPTDSRCEYLEWDRDSLGCGCGCQRCPDKKIYGLTTDYQKMDPLSDADVKKCPHIKYPIAEHVDFCLIRGAGVESK